jgi:hypothetical protein
MEVEKLSGFLGLPMAKEDNLSCQIRTTAEIHWLSLLI